MPNWCQCELTIRGSPKACRAFKQAIAGDNGVIDFNKVIPMPAVTDGDAVAYTLKFDTAWSPPMQVLQVLRRSFPQLIIEFEYEDEYDCKMRTIEDDGTIKIRRE
jgi:hypothetical protein